MRFEQCGTVGVNTSQRTNGRNAAGRGASGALPPCTAPGRSRTGGPPACHMGPAVATGCTGHLCLRAGWKNRRNQQCSPILQWSENTEAHQTLEDTGLIMCQAGHNVCTLKKKLTMQCTQLCKLPKPIIFCQVTCMTFTLVYLTFPTI